jgi:uncharacterized protein DUF4325
MNQRTHCDVVLRANRHASNYILGTRAEAGDLRPRLESALQETDRQICLDFSGVEVTQSFMDELIGVLMLRYGPSLLDRVAFVGCSDDARAVISFVLEARAADYKRL